jgi:phenylpyruvate tautomerase PptA (4-oxalocrotonate tautomerase family)
MPILEVEVVLRPNEFLVSDLAERLAEAAAGTFASPKGSVWVKLRAIQLTEYAENGGLLEGVQPVFVKVLKSKVPRRGELEHEIARLTEALARACERPPENVHVVYEPDGTGRAAFGGRLVK